MSARRESVISVAIGAVLWECALNPAIIAGFPKHPAAMSAQIVDSFEFCRTGAQAAGTTPVAEFKRLSADLADSSGDLHWSFQGGLHPEGDPQLLMEVSGTVRLVCQRCMAPFDHAMASHTTLVLAVDDAQADEAEERLDDDSIDVIVGSKAMDLMTLVEDEALLSLPLSPRHESCPGPAPELGEGKAESPFSVLRKLKE